MEETPIIFVVWGRRNGGVIYRRRIMTAELENGLFAIAGAVIGALVTAVFAWLQARVSASRAELTVFSTRAARLLEVDSTISQAVEVRIHGKVVPNIYTAGITIRNSGTLCLENVGASAQIEGPGDIISAEINEKPTGIDSSSLTLESTKQSLELKAVSRPSQSERTGPRPRGSTRLSFSSV